MNRERVRVVLATRTLLSFISSWRAAALALVDLGPAALFAAGVAESASGRAAPWLLLLAVLIAACLRAVDIEARALFVRGGLHGMVRDALGPGAGAAAAAALLGERLLCGALVASVAGHYVAALLPSVAYGGLPVLMPAADIPVTAALAVVGIVWLMQHQGRRLHDSTVTRIVVALVSVTGVLLLWGTVTIVSRGGSLPPIPIASTSSVLAFLLPIAAIGSLLFVAGDSETLSHIASGLDQPRIRNLQRTAYAVVVFSALGVAALAFVIATSMSDSARAAWRGAPLAGLAMTVAGPEWLRLLALIAVTISGAAFLVLAARSALAGAHGVLARLVEEQVLPVWLRALHPRFGTPWRLVAAAAVAQLAVVLVTSGRLDGIATAYAAALVWCYGLKIAALMRFRSLRPEARPYRVALNIRVGARQWPIGLAGLFVVVVVSGVLAPVVADPAAIAAWAALTTLAAVVATRHKSGVPHTTAVGELDDFQLLPSDEVDLLQVEARPGNLLVPVRKPHALTHLAAALRSSAARDIVVMTARLVGLDVPDDPAVDPRPTEDERRLFSAVMAEAERHGRAVRLLIAPGTNVFDAIAETALRLQSSEIHVGESETLSTQEQARRLGDAWERASGPKPLGVRLVIHHPSGRTAAFLLGAHAPALGAEELDLIHRLWLDVVTEIPHVHHRDVVRTALKHMEDELKGPAREEVLARVRETARPGDELASVVRERDFARLRDMVRNRPAGDLARVLTDLPVDEQVVVFRILPRRQAAETFEYLSSEAQENLLKAMAQEDVAALLNNMSPDDRTVLLEELPAAVTRQLLALLTPQERAVAVTLLGYPERSIGRLMTPHYIAVREDWTVQQVLDYIRAHGQDSETLNVIYVVDDEGVLIDDIRIREFLLRSPSNRVRDLMDRHFVALKAADDQETAVAVFRREDRSALPVTDSAGVLIGIITVDDVLDVAEAAATEDIQRLGGSEALDEPYMRIAFTRMIQKRAGWLTALFLGEMLTATAMGVFEREIQKAVVLALFVPLIISSGGNSGSQASTLVIRALALGEVKLIDWWRVMRREFAAGLALGGILGAIGFLRISVWSAFSTIYGEHWLLVAITVATSLVGVVLWGTLTGSLLPFLLRRLGFDPAASSAPFVATLVDVTGLVIYFSVGIVILRGTLL